MLEQRIKLLDDEIAAAVADKDFFRAGELASEIERLDKGASQIAELQKSHADLEDEIPTAVANQDYARVEELGRELARLEKRTREILQEAETATLSKPIAAAAGRLSLTADAMTVEGATAVQYEAEIQMYRVEVELVMRALVLKHQEPPAHTALARPRAHTSARARANARMHC